RLSPGPKRRTRLRSPMRTCLSLVASSSKLERFTCKKIRCWEKRTMGRGKKRGSHPAALLSARPLYATGLGAAYAGDALDLIKLLPNRSVNTIITSPPYALHFKKSYGNPSQAEYIDWFMTFVEEFRRVLRPNGSLVLEIGGAWNRGEPTRSIY